MKARILLGTALLALVAVAGSFAVVWLTRPIHRINRVSFGLLKQGMAKDEVETILRCQPGDYGSGPLARCEDETLTPIDELERWYAMIPQVHIWSGDDGALLIHFNEDNTVRAMVFMDVVPLGFFPSLQRWLSRIAGSGQ